MSITHTCYIHKKVVQNIQHITTHNAFILLSKTLLLLLMMMMMYKKSVILQADLCGFEI